jgi:hypothetical protein
MKTIGCIVKVKPCQYQDLSGFKIVDFNKIAKRVLESSIKADVRR